MLYSQNGYVAKDYSLIASYTLPGHEKAYIALRKGDVSVVLLYLMKQFNETVERLSPSQCGGYNPRSVIGGRDLSNHASGTAVDLNWNKHVLGNSGTFTPLQLTALRKILKYLEGVVRWGGDYRGRKDEMHFEVNAPLDKIEEVADKIRNGNKPKMALPPTPMKPNATLRIGMVGPIVKTMQTRLNICFPQYSRLRTDGQFGAKTEAVVKEFQRRTGLTPDGKVGPLTRRMMKRFGIVL